VFFCLGYNLIVFSSYLIFTTFNCEIQLVNLAFKSGDFLLLLVYLLIKSRLLALHLLFKNFPALHDLIYILFKFSDLLLMLISDLTYLLKMRLRSIFKFFFILTLDQL